MTDDPTGPVRVAVETGRRSEWAISPWVFGRFAEHIGGAIYPGVFENYVKNGSFDVWNTSGGRGGIVFPGVDAHETLAYPWEPVTVAGDARFEQRVGGVRGRRNEEALVDGVEVPANHQIEPPGVTEPRYQRIELDGEGGIQQRVALPDRRERSYDAAISVRGDTSECVVRLDSPDGDQLAREPVPVEETWTRHEVTLTLDAESPRRYSTSVHGGVSSSDEAAPDLRADQRYGDYRLTVSAVGGGVLDVDWVTLIPGDAIEGKFNPSTVERLRQSNVTSLRWPGGNYASQYRWRNGVGPVVDRPVVPVANWGGLDQNYLGTNEWLRFCELVEAEPYITVPVWSPAGPEEAAAWVEYCNGSVDTEMGALRAEHGYSEPWNVSYWGVGNEVWGSWQIGRTDADDYAERYEDYHEAMREADADIEVDACAVDPWFTLVHDGTREGVTLPAAGGEPPVWNERLFEGASETIEGVDVHRYTEGISGHTSESGARDAWLEQHDETPLGYVEVLVNDPGTWGEMFDEIRALASDHGIEDLRITFGEWGLRAHEVDEGWPQATRGTMAHAVFSARALQALLRNGRDVELAHWTDFSQYVSPGPRGGSVEHPGATIFEDVAEPIRETVGEWHLIETTVSDSPTRDRPATGVSIPTGEVPLVDAVTIGTTGADPRLQTLLVNGSLTRSETVAVEYGDCVDAVRVTLFRGGADDPFARKDGSGDEDGYVVERSELTGDEADPADLTLPPASVAILSWASSD